jgi:hypothetical protein
MYSTKKEQPSSLEVCFSRKIRQPPPLKGAFGALGACVWPPSPPTNSEEMEACRIMIKQQPEHVNVPLFYIKPHCTSVTLPPPQLLHPLFTATVTLAAATAAACVDCSRFACCLGARACVCVCVCLRVCMGAKACVCLCVSFLLLLLCRQPISQGQTERGKLPDRSSLCCFIISKFTLPSLNRHPKIII